MFGQVHLLKTKMRKAMAQLPYLPKALAMAWQVARPWTICWIALLVLQGVLPGASVYLTKLIVDSLVAVTQGRSPIVHPLWLVLMLALTLVASEIVRSGISWTRTVQAELLQDHIKSLIHLKSVSVDLAFYELPDYYDHLHRARSEAGYRPVALLDNLGALLQNTITLIAMGAILIPLGPWLAVALVLSTLPAFYVVVHYALAEYQWRMRTTADDRRTWYYDWIMTTSDAAAELRLFNLGKYFQSTYRNLRARLRTERLQLTRRQTLSELSASIIALVIVVSAFGWMVHRAMLGAVTLGDLALTYAAFNQGQRLMRTLLENLAQLYANSLFLGDLFEFLSLKPAVTPVEGENARQVTRVHDEIRFEKVLFRYPDAKTEAIKDFDLVIPAGQIVAVVGSNGAGKSTLVKLLCRFYDPAGGNIFIDRANLREIPVDQLRRLITVLFQQPFHYNSTVRENIQFGDQEIAATDDEISAAICAAGAEGIVARLPERETTLLGKWFAGGTELSTGEWQRIALARAFLRHAPVIILDEPTSALDPWAEADWLERFRELADGRTAIIITHRFTTAMHADVIHVMDNGKIVESGSHQQLLDIEGLYAKSWRQQISNAKEREDIRGLVFN